MDLCSGGELFDRIVDRCAYAGSHSRLRRAVATAAAVQQQQAAGPVLTTSRVVLPLTPNPVAAPTARRMPRR